MLSPLELENKRILTSKRKYDRFEMDEYLDLIFENYKALFNEYEEQKKQIKTLTEGIQYYRSIESTMQKALLLAEKTSKETKDAAILKAEAIEKDANNKANQIINTAEAEYSRIREKCLELVQQFNQYKAQLQVAANEQLRLITSATFEVETPEIAGQEAPQASVTPPMMTEMSSFADVQPAEPAPQAPVMNGGMPEIHSPGAPVAPEMFTEAPEEAPTEAPQERKSSVYSFSSTGNTQPLPDLSQALAAGQAPVSEPFPTVQQPQMEVQPSVVAQTPPPVQEMPIQPVQLDPTPAPEAAPAPAPVEEEVDITSQFEMYTEAPPLEPQPQVAEPVPDKTMILPDVKDVDREALRGSRQAMTAAEQQSILEAETINLSDSIRAVRDQEQVTLEVPSREEQPPVVQLEPAEPEVQMQPQGLDSILQNITIGKKKKTNGESAEDPFEFLGSVDDF